MVNSNLLGKESPRFGADFALADFAPRRTAVVEIRRPVSCEIIQVCPTRKFLVHCSESRDGIDIIPGNPPAEMRLKPKQKLLRVAVSHLGDVFLWPTPANGPLAKQLKKVFGDVATGWLQISWCGDSGTYKTRPVPELPEPEWPPETLEDLIAIASPKLLQQYRQEEGGCA